MLQYQNVQKTQFCKRGSNIEYELSFSRGDYSKRQIWLYSKMLQMSTKLCVCFLCLILIIDLRIVAGITVSTVNLWNLMFNWNVRKHRIVEMVCIQHSDLKTIYNHNNACYENI